MVRQPRRLAAVAIAVAICACGSDAAKDPPPKREPPAATPRTPTDGVADKLAQHRAAYAYLQETFAKRRRRDGTRQELLDYLADAYRKDKLRAGTLDEQLGWLDEVYAGSKLDADGTDPDTMYAVDVGGAMAAGQIEGPTNAPVTIILAFDYACPHCARARSILHDLVAEYGSNVRVIYMHMIVHPDTVGGAHRFACAAARQRKFLAFHDGVYDKLFAAYSSTSGRDRAIFDDAHLEALGTSVGLDARALRSDASGSECRRRLDEDRAELDKFALTGTPTFFVNGKLIAGGVPRTTLASAIDRELAIAVASGIPGREYYGRVVYARGEHALKAKKRAPTLP